MSTYGTFDRENEMSKKIGINFHPERCLFCRVHSRWPPQMPLTLNLPSHWMGIITSSTDASGGRQVHSNAPNVKMNQSVFFVWNFKVVFIFI